MGEQVFITREIPEKGIQLLREFGCDIIIHKEKRELRPDELISICKQSEALLNVGTRLKLDADFFQQCTNLKAVALYSVGFNHVDLEAAKKAGIQVSNTPDVLTDSTADIAFLLMQLLSRKAIYMSEKVKKGEWGFFEPTANLGSQPEGKTLGIFGLGRIGENMARKCQAAFGMNIIYHNRHRNLNAEKELNARFVSFDELLAQSDVLSIHANLSTETTEIFNSNAFKKMKPSAIFINTARGGFHNETDLYQALIKQEIAAAGLDVTNPEPMDPNNPILNLPNVVVLPHIGSATIETREKMAIMAANNLIAALKGEIMPQRIR